MSVAQLLILAVAAAVAAVTVKSVMLARANRAKPGSESHDADEHAREAVDDA